MARWRTLDTARRIGLLDPANVAAFGTAALVWGPGSAAAYAAAATRSPRRTALVDDHGSLSYLQLDQRAGRLAGGLKALGVRSGQVVGLLCRNHRGFVEANLAFAKLGARVVYLNPGLPANQLLEVIGREQVTLIIADRDLADRCQTDGGSAPRVVIAAPEDDARWSFPAVPKWRPLIQLPSPFTTDDPIVLTSGTTGAPKGTRRSAGRGTAEAAFGVLDAIPLRRHDVMVLPAPLFHAWGLSQLVMAATLGATVVLRRRFDPEQVAADVEAHGADVLAVVPVMLHRLLDAELTFDLSSLRVVASSGSALPGELAARWMERHGANLYNLYGSTEVGQVSIATPADLLHDPSTAGRPVGGVDVRLLDADGNAVTAPGRVGDIVVRSAMHFDGYTDGQTKAMFEDYMSIGDRGRFDDDGRLYVVGRADDMIISGGENLYPANIERVLISLPDVSEAVVVGVDDDDLGQRVRAVIVGTHDTEPDIGAIQKLAVAELAPHERPREYIVIDEVPRNASGKILRRELTGPADSLRGYRSATAQKARRKPRGSQKPS